LPTVVDTVVTALAAAIPERIPAAHHGVMGGASIVFFGVDPKTKRRFVTQSIEGAGWGGRPTEDGESGSVSICQGDVRNASIEGLEMKSPILVENRGYRPDSGGAGKFRGGVGLEIRASSFVEGRWNMDRPSRVLCPPWGLWGGKPGVTAAFFTRKPGENDFQSTYGFRLALPPGTEVLLRTSGGGGWGDPLDRDPERVRVDVVEELVSREAASKLYGVVIREDLSLDESATVSLRRERASSRAAAPA
jgi:N-methylhydantoinase B